MSESVAPEGVRAEMSGHAAIDARDLTKVYETTVAVDRLDLSLGSGRILGLVGPNGAGKTTALRCLAGIIPATEGSIKIGGYDIRRDPLAAKRILAFIPDTPHLFDYLTVEEHLMFAARLYQVEDAEAKADALLEEFELVEKRTHLPQALSRGMRQKLAICMGFLHEPRAIFLDEPLTGLDPAGIRRMKNSIMRRAREGGAACIVSSHQLELVEEISDEVFIIKRGRRVVSGSVETIRRDIADLPDGVSLEEIFFRVTEDAPAGEESDSE